MRNLDWPGEKKLSARLSRLRKMATDGGFCQGLTLVIADTAVNSQRNQSTASAPAQNRAQDERKKSGAKRFKLGGVGPGYPNRAALKRNSCTGRRF
jgi:hypothetical protein